MTKRILLYAGNYVTGKVLREKIWVPVESSGRPTASGEEMIAARVDAMFDILGEDTSLWDQTAAAGADAELAADESFLNKMRYIALIKGVDIGSWQTA